jgi:hypothetical protein
VLLLRTALLTLIPLLVLCALPASAQSLCRFYLADQYDYDGNMGFYLDFEGSELTTLPIFLCVADGTAWRYPSHAPGFEFGRDYEIHAVISPEGAQLSLDGTLVIDSPGGWEPAPGDLQVNYRPSWATESGDWVAVLSSLTVVLARGGEEVARHEFDISAAAQHVPLKLFELTEPTRVALDSQPGDTLTIDATLRFGSSDLAAWEPFIDRYGQCIYADWPAKVSSDADLTADLSAEDARLAEMPPSPRFDQYGGYLNHDWEVEATGFFQVIERDGFWWLVSPEGNPCFYVGCSLVPATSWPGTPVTDRQSLFEWIPPQEAPWIGAWMHDPWGAGEAADYVNFYQCNLIRKYGAEDWYQQAYDRALRRLDCWGFGGGGKWGSPGEIVSTPVLWTSSTPILVRHPDIFDPAVTEQFRSELAGRIEPSREDPRILGWSFQSEYDALITRDEVRQILGTPADTPSKQQLMDYALDEMYGGSLPELTAAWGVAAADRSELYATSPDPPADDVEDLRCWYADEFYEWVYTTIKSIDPNHLVIAPWIVPGWWESEQDWHIQARHCDIMGYDRYAMQYDDDFFLRLQSEIDRPTLCGEFSFPPFYRGERGFGHYWTSWSDDDADAGRRYYDWIRSAAQDPSCVGMIWFHYRDQPLTGRGTGFGPDLVYGEHYAFGLVTETDRVKWPLVERVREANLSAPEWRKEAMGLGPFPDVPPSHWAAGEIRACANARVVGGYPDGNYHPDWDVTRGQMAVFVARTLATPTGEAGIEAYEPPEEAPTFPDVPEDYWSFKHIEYLAERVVVAGYPDGLYRPAEWVTRDQMGVYIARAIADPIGEPGLASYTPPATPSFSDVDAEHWAYRHIEYLAGGDVVSGYPDGYYRPNRIVTRDQMAVYIARAFELQP